MHYPSIDLHGEYTVTAYTLVHNFISDNIKLKNEFIIIIHGKGTGRLKEEVHRILKCDKRVDSFRQDGFNLGQTIVKLKLKS